MQDAATPSPVRNPKKGAIIRMTYEISIVIPAKNEEAAIPLLYQELEKARISMNHAAFEYLFVDDGSTDGTLACLKALGEQDVNVHYLSFSRNFGKEAAIYAGLSYAKGRYIVVMDADLQDPPELLPELYRAVTEEGYDCAGTRRVTRKGEPLFRSLSARCFYRIIQRTGRTLIPDGARDFQIMNRKVADAILSLGEYNRFFKGLSSWVGYRRKWIEFENRERAAGETKWTFGQLTLYAFDGLLSFSTAPLVFASVIGSIFCLVAFFLIIFIIIKTLVFGDPTSGWPSMACLIMMVSGVQLFCIGILGQYQAKTYLETKRRPLYLLSSSSLEEESHSI